MNWWYCCLLVSSLAAVQAAWVEPEDPPSLTVVGPDSVAVGSEGQYSCTAEKLPEYTTMHWLEIAGGLVQSELYTRGPSVLWLNRTVTAAQNGVELVCRTVFSRTAEDGRVQSYFVQSAPVIVNVEGVTTVLPPATNGITVDISTNATTLNVGDGFQITCVVTNLGSSSGVVLDVRQEKDGIEIQHHTGWQATRQLNLSATAADRGSKFYCLVWSGIHGNAYYSPKLTLNVN